MSYAICQTCGAEVRWRAYRGTKLADHRCHCGGALRGKTAGRGGATVGKHFYTCAYCQRRRLETKLVTLPRATWFIGAEVPAGARVCRWHELAEPGGLTFAHRAGTTSLLVSIGHALAEEQSA